MAKKLPKYIQHKHGSYYYVRRISGNPPKWIKLGKTEADMYRKLADIKENEANKGTMADYFDRYKKEIIPTKAERTQVNNKAEIKNLRKVFGHMLPHQITPVFIYGYMDKRGQKSKVSANLEKALLSNVFSYLIRWGIVGTNPCVGVKAFTIKPRNRYVTDKEYKAVYDYSPPLIQCAMEIAVITGMRQGDILNLKLLDIQEDGIHLTANKTGKKQIINWTTDLKKVVKECKKLSKVSSHTHLICNQKGKAYTSSGFKTMWQKAMNSAIEKKVIHERFTFRDLRPKAASDHTDGTKLLDHSDPKTTKKYYLRKPAKVTPIR